jgi:hypothetical protein
MDSTLLVGILGLIGSVATPFIAESIKGKIGARSIPEIAKDRMTSLQGRWEGTLLQESNTAEGVLNLSIVIKGHNIEGELQQELKWDGRVEKDIFKVKGEFIHYRFVNLSYINDDKSIIHFGNVLLEYSDNGRSLIGRYLGYGAKSANIIFGQLTLHKKS